MRVQKPSPSPTFSRSTLPCATRKKHHHHHHRSEIERKWSSKNLSSPSDYNNWRRAKSEKTSSRRENNKEKKKVLNKTLTHKAARKKASKWEYWCCGWLVLHSQEVSPVEMKTENVLVTSVKTEPLNYVVGNSQSYGDNLYGSATKKQRLERWGSRDNHSIVTGQKLESCTNFIVLCFSSI